VGSSKAEADCQDVEKYKRKHPLNLLHSNIGLLRVFELIEYKDWEQLAIGKMGMTATLMTWRS
jgi:hypothetical protein